MKRVAHLRPWSAYNTFRIVQNKRSSDFVGWKKSICALFAIYDVQLCMWIIVVLRTFCRISNWSNNILVQHFCNLFSQKVIDTTSCGLLFIKLTKKIIFSCLKYPIDGAFHSFVEMIFLIYDIPKWSVFSGFQYCNRTTLPDFLVCTTHIMSIWTYEIQ